MTLAIILISMRNEQSIDANFMIHMSMLISALTEALGSLKFPLFLCQSVWLEFV